MWPFNKPASTEVVTLLQSVAKLRQRVDVLEEDHEALKAQHLSLRGRVYALWGKEPAAAPANQPAEPVSGGLAGNLSKAELRKQLTTSGRFIPGKPPVHE